MCVVSMAGDYWKDRVMPNHPWYSPGTTPSIPVTRSEFDALKRDVEALKELLIAAKKFDETVGEPDCETDEKVALIRKVAEYVGVDLKDVI